VGRIVNHDDELDAPGVVMRGGPISRLLGCERGTTAVELGLVLPALAAVLVGGLYGGVAVYSAAGLQTAVEQAARCYSVNATTCSDAPTTQTYAQGKYNGAGAPVFTASVQSCGHQVSATVTIPLFAVVADFNVPLNAAACFP